MENAIRRYKAFISYRHLPLDMEVAEKIHKIIEHYVIPRELRKNGEKKLGYVFRDKDELPISGNLSANIQTALDNAEFLIVICRPETQKSIWVMQEIQHFIETHDRDHVLAVLADGLPEESFPDLLTQITAEDGSVFSKIEPLAANVAAKSRAKRNRLLKTESLRLLAALVGCPYDKLFKREQRYRHRRNMAIAGLAAAIVLTFMGMLINRNQEINRQLQQSLINESNALSAMSWNLYQDGQYSEAIEAAVKALPWQGNERPYVEEAEYTLSRELNVYGVDSIHYLRSFSQDTDIYNLALSRDGSKTAVYSREGTLALVDSRTGITQWSREMGNLTCKGLCVTELPGVMADLGSYFGYFRCDNGELIWELTDSRYICHSEPLKICVTGSLQDNVGLFVIRDLDSGAERQTIRWENASEDTQYSTIACGAVSDDGHYAAFVLSWMQKAVLLIADLHTGEICFETDVTRGEAISLFYSGYLLAFTEQNHLVMAFDSDELDADISLYDSENGWHLRYAKKLDTESSTYLVGTTVYWDGGLDLLTCGDGCLILADYRDVYYLEEATGEVTANVQLPAAISSAAPTGNGSIGVILKNGLITTCYPDGQTGAEQRTLFYECGYDVGVSALNGDNFREETFAVVPIGYPSHIAVLREAENPRMDEVISMKNFPLFSNCLVSPSGKLVAMVKSKYEGMEKNVEGLLCHTETGEKRLFRLENVGPYNFAGTSDTVLTDDGLLRSNGMVYDIKKKKLSWLSDTGEKPQGYDMYRQGTADGGATVYTVQELKAEDGSISAGTFCIWKNDEKFAVIECPELEVKVDRYQCLQVTGDLILFQCKRINLEAFDYSDFYYLVYSISTGEFTMLQIPENMDLGAYSACFAMAGEKALLAVLDGDNICIYNTKTGEMCASVAHGWYEASFCKLQFALGDTLLFGFTNDSRILIYEVQSGQLLGQVNLDSSTYSFSKSVDYSFYEIEDQNRILLVLQTSGQRLGVMLRRSDWAVVGLHDGIVDFRAETGELLVYPYLRGVYCCKLLNGDEIIAIGREYLTAGSAQGEGEAEND